jgi:hypothetical protein
MEKKLPPLLTGCIVTENSFDCAISINNFIDNAGMCKPVYYCTAPEKCDNNYRKVLDWIRDDVVGDIIIDSYCFINLRLQDILSIDRELEDSAKSIYIMKDNVIQEIDLKVLLNDIQKLDLGTIDLEIF